MAIRERRAAAPISSLANPEMVRMRDGIRLATDVYLPGGGGTAGDTVLIRLPYDKSGEYAFIPLIAEYFMTRGWRVVAQDVRGKFRSEGIAVLWENEVADGYDTVEWITRQPWSNGRVAMWGDSYYGYTQWAAVSSGHPALKAIAPRVTGTRLGLPVVSGGVQGVEWSATYIYPLEHFLTNDSFAWVPDMTKRPFAAQAEEFMASVGTRSVSYDQHAPHHTFRRRFPNGHPFDAPAVPALHTIGWWDNCAPQAWADVAEIDDRPNWAMNHFLRIESMDHEGYYLLDPGRADVTEDEVRAALPRMVDPALDFFEVFVRGNGSAADLPKVVWNLAGTEEMRIASKWPPAGVVEDALYATAAGELDAVPSAFVTDLTWTHDPDDLVPSSVEDAFGYLGESPNEAPIGNRGDVLVFDGLTLDHSLDLVGPVSATATIQSDGPIMDLFLRLLDVRPDGTAIRVVRGQTSISHPDKPTKVTIDLGQAGYRLEAGHRLRLHVSSSDFPEFLPQPGTGHDPWLATATHKNHQRLRVGGGDGLTLKYSILPRAHSAPGQSPHPL